MNKNQSGLAVGLVLVGLLAPTANAKPKDKTSVDYAMRSFIYAIKTKNSNLALYYVPKSGLKIQNSLYKDQFNTMSYEDLKRNKAWVNNIIDADFSGDYSLGKLIRDAGYERWRRSNSNRFMFAKDRKDDPDTYIEWKKEGKKWTISVVGYYSS